jgi:hypothetical protein
VALVALPHNICVTTVLVEAEFKVPKSFSKYAPRLFVSGSVKSPVTVTADEIDKINNKVVIINRFFIQSISSLYNAGSEKGFVTSYAGTMDRCPSLEVIGGLYYNLVSACSDCVSWKRYDVSLLVFDLGGSREFVE